MDMWYKLYKYMQFLDKLPDHSTVEMDKDLYVHCRAICFVDDYGYIKFNGKTFCLG